jgi:hypothetical protein
MIVSLRLFSVSSVSSVVQSDILEKILAVKLEEVAAAKRSRPLVMVRAKRNAPASRGTLPARCEPGSPLDFPP